MCLAKDGKDVFISPKLQACFVEGLARSPTTRKYLEGTVVVVVVVVVVYRRGWLSCVCFRVQDLVTVVFTRKVFFIVDYRVCVLAYVVVIVLLCTENRKWGWRPRLCNFLNSVCDREKRFNVTDLMLLTIKHSFDVCSNRNVEIFQSCQRPSPSSFNAFRESFKVSQLQPSLI